MESTRNMKQPEKGTKPGPARAPSMELMEPSGPKGKKLLSNEDCLEGQKAVSKNKASIVEDRKRK